MITFYQFELFIKALDEYFKREELLGENISPFNSSYTAIEFCPLITDTIFDFLKEEFNDTDEWIQWWYWDHRSNPNLKAYDENKEEIKMDTLLDLYRFLTNE